MKRLRPKSRQDIALYAVVLMLLFVFLHSWIPADPRVRLGVKRFEPEFGISPQEIWYAVKKWRHIVYFSIFFPLIAFLFEKQAVRRAYVSVFIVTLLIEFEECFVAGRHGRIVDLLPNLIGSYIGARIFVKWRSREAGRSSSRDNE